MGALLTVLTVELALNEINEIRKSKAIFFMLGDEFLVNRFLSKSINEFLWFLIWVQFLQIYAFRNIKAN
jgi:hypothetical protein